MTSKDLLEVGQIAGAHGIQGAVLLRSFAQDAGLLIQSGKVLLQGPGESAREYVLESFRPHKGMVLAFLEGVSDRNGAEALKGRLILVPKASLPAPEPGEYYWFQLIGLDVVEKDGSRLGVLESIIETGSNDVYVVKDGKRETLVPALSWVILSVDLEAATMVVDLPEGL